MDRSTVPYVLYSKCLTNTVSTVGESVRAWPALRCRGELTVCILPGTCTGTVPRTVLYELSTKYSEYYYFKSKPTRGTNTLSAAHRW
jgi:hypothetical protein